MLGAEERRPRRIKEYAAARSDRLPASGGKAIRRKRTSAADDALMVHQGKYNQIDLIGLI